MKGTPEAPRCGFSMRAVGILEQMGTEYGAIDVLPVLQPLREVTTEIADWQTFPQLWVDGELLGGADLMEEMLESGELAEALGVPQPDRPKPKHEPAGPTVGGAVPQRPDADRDSIARPPFLAKAPDRGACRGVGRTAR